MDRISWEQGREERETKAREEHGRLHRLFQENRFAFELERKRAIEEVINSAPDEETRERLRALQASWDHILQKSGSKYNRFILAKTLFWDHFHQVWSPAVQRFQAVLEGNPGRKRFKE